MNKTIKTLISSAIVFAIIMAMALVLVPLGISDIILGWLILVATAGSSMALGCMYIAND